MIKTILGHNCYQSPEGKYFYTDELLEMVKDWEDPYAEPVIEQHDGVFVVRDDLGSFNLGSKARFIDKIVKDSTHKEWVYASPASGFAQISLPAVCKKYGKRAVIFEAERNLEKLHPFQQRSLDMGADIKWVKMGMLNVIQAHAKKYVAEDPKNRFMAPFGLDHELIIASIIKVARSIPFLKNKLYEPDEIYSAAGSGTLSRGLQLAFPNAKVFAVSVGHKLTPREIGRANVIYSEYKFDKEAKKNERPPFPSALNYDAKVWKHIPKDGGRVRLFWNVGA